MAKSLEQHEQSIYANEEGFLARHRSYSLRHLPHWNGIVGIIGKRLIHAHGDLLRPRADTLTGILRKTMA